MTGRLPTLKAPLLGRTDEIEQMTALLASPGLVTITGAGGTGKTCVAIEAARRLEPAFRDGVIFVDLSAVRDPSDVGAAIERALDLSEIPTERAIDSVARAISLRALLLVLDNFEQVLAAGLQVITLCENCPSLTVVVTSRAPLRVTGERVVDLLPLAVPPSASADDPAAIEQFASVQLFCERAAAIRPSFALTAGNADSIVAICRLVDGLPLAIELAAARVGHLAPAALLERLDGHESLDVLTRGATDLPQRQRTLRDTISWSYNLLQPDEQRLLGSLAIFTSACSLDAIEAVCSTGDPSSVAVLDALAALVDFHLVEPNDSDPLVARFSMFETIREFAREQLVAANDERRLRERHTRYYLDVAAAAAVGLETRAESDWMHRLELALVEIRAAYADTLAQGDPVEGLEAVAGIGKFWLFYGHVVEGLAWLTRFRTATRAVSVPDAVGAHADLWAARLAMEESNDAANPALLEQLRSGLARVRGSNDRVLEMRALFLVATSARREGALDTFQLAVEGVTRARADRDRWWLTEFLVAAAQAAQYDEDRERAAQFAAEACGLAVDVGNDRALVVAQIVLALSAPGTQYAAVAPRLVDVEPLAVARAPRRMVAWLYPVIGGQAFVAGHIDEAAGWWHRGLVFARDHGYWSAEGFCIMGAQAVLFARGELDASARLYGALAAELPALRRGIPPEQFDAWHVFVTTLRDSMGPEAFEAQAALGVPMRWQDAAAVALRVTAPTDATLEPAMAAPASGHDYNLTIREQEVLQSLAAGGTNKDIAAALGISAKTVMHHTVAIYRKLGVRGRAEATAFALRAGLVEGLSGGA